MCRVCLLTRSLPHVYTQPWMHLSVLDGAYLNRFVVEQTPYYLLDRQVERELIPMAQSYGMRLTVWLPLAESFLTGKYRPGSARPEAARFHETRDQSA